MRLLQLNPNGNDASALDFHPMVTVVHGLSDAGRDLLIKAITALPRGEDPGCHGLVEAHGVLLDLTTDALALLDLDSDLEVLVQPSDIPGFQPGVGMTLSGMPGTGTLPVSLGPLSASDFLAVTEEGEYPELDALRRGQSQSREALEILKGASVKAAKGLEDAQVRRRRVELALEQAREAQPRSSLRLVTDEFDPDDDVDAGDDLEIDRRAFGSPDGGDAIAPMLPPAPPVPPAEHRAALETRSATLEAQIAKIDRGINELAGVDARPVQVLLDAIRNPAPIEMVPSTRGQELADEFVRLQTEVQILEESLDARGLGSQASMARLDAARNEVAAAEKAMRPPEYTDLDRSELETAHDDVLEITQKSRGRNAKKRLDEVLAKEQAILDRMGFPTWSAYVMGAGLMGIDPAAEQRLEKARFELEAAERHWSDVAAMIEADPVHRTMLDELEAVYLEAFDLLQGDDEQQDLDFKLRNLQQPKRDVSIDELVEALAYQLELVGIALPQTMITLDRTVMIAEAFLEEAGAIIHRLNELGGEKVEALTELQTIEEELETMPSFEELDAAEAADLAELAAANLTAEDLARLEQDLERDLETAAEDETDWRDLLEAREALVDVAIRIESVATIQLNKLATELAAKEDEEDDDDGEDGEDADEGTDTATDTDTAVVNADEIPDSDEAFDDVADVNAGAEAIEFYLLARLSALRTVSYAGSVPLVIDDALTGRTEDEVRQVLHKLERMSETVQIVYLSDDDTVSTWARSIGYERAAVIAAPPAFA